MQKPPKRSIIWPGFRSDVPISFLFFISAISAAIKTTSQNLHKSRDKLVRRDNKMKRSDIDYEEKDALRKIAQTTKSPFFNKLEMDLVLFRDKDERMVSSKGYVYFYVFIVISTYIFMNQKIISRPQLLFPGILL